jgi:hypothetical protein
MGIETRPPLAGELSLGEMSTACNREKDRTFSPGGLVEFDSNLVDSERRPGNAHPDTVIAPQWLKADYDAGGRGGTSTEPSRHETLVKALVRAHRWRRKIESGQAKSITDFAEQEGLTDAYVCRLLALTCLAPDILEAILDGR